MKDVLFVYTFNTSSKSFGGIKSILESYFNNIKLFDTREYRINLFNYKPELVGKKGKIGHVLYGIKQTYMLWRYLRHHHCDLVHFHTSRDFLFMKDVLMAKMIKRRFGIPVLMTIHVGAAETVFSKTVFFQNSLIKTANKYIDKLLFLSKAIKDDFINLGLSAERGDVLYNFHDLTPLTVPDERKQSDTINLIFVGAIHQEKGILELLTALKSLSIPYHLDICGIVKDLHIKDEFDKITKEMSGKVTMHGMVSGAEKTQLYLNADVLVLPSYHEGMPMVILEALSTKCGIISTRVGATPEILDESNALWVDVKSSSQIADAVVYLYSNNDTLNNMKVNNFNLSRKFSLEYHIESLCSIYNSITR